MQEPQNYSSPYEQVIGGVFSAYWVFECTLYVCDVIFTGHTHPVRCICHSPSKPVFITTSDDFRIKFWMKRELALPRWHAYKSIAATHNLIRTNQQASTCWPTVWRYNAHFSSSIVRILCSCIGHADCFNQLLYLIISCTAAYSTGPYNLSTSSQPPTVYNV